MEAEKFTFSQDDLKRTSFLAFEEMRKNGELCDITLKIQQKTITAHRVVLAAAIPYFRSLFTEEAGEVEEKNIAMEHLDPHTLESLIDFAYSAKINISVENAQTLLRTSEILQLKEVRNACVEFLSERLNVDNILEVCTFACNLNIPTLTQNCIHYLQENFEEFAKRKEFLSLPYPCIKDVISSDELNAFDEVTVFEAVITWVKYSPEERQNILPDLMREIRMTSLPVSYLVKTVAAEELVKASAACKDLIQDVQSFHLLPREDTAFLNLNTALRKNMNKEIYAICYFESREHSVYCCDFSTEKWNRLHSIESDKCSIIGVVGANDTIYIFLENRIKTFHVKTLKWEVLEPTHKHMLGTSVLMHKGRIYCFGSLSVSFLDKLRCFDTRQKKWLAKEQMMTGRANTAVASHKESIFVTGGYRDIQTFRTVEQYDPSQKQWFELSPMLFARSLHGCASINGKIYVFGGGCQNTSYIMYSDSGEMYDPLTNAWSTISPMTTGRNKFSLVSHCAKLHALGGRTKSDHPSGDAEIYDPERDEWKSGIRVPEGLIGAVVM